ncbi:MAG: PEP/pyruvate-binding domain-containing protein [Candidatus Riflebacteria bacterium]|nr:PEP/pyruvate-binding domain-containing protein [Candidatus Riflebacteria bacterium]
MDPQDLWSVAQVVDRPDGRAKELSCLCAVAETLNRAEVPLDHRLQLVVELIPSGFEHPARCRARISWGWTFYQTPGFQESATIHRASIGVAGQSAGQIEVAYVEAHGEEPPGPFSWEERKLIDLIARKIGQAIDSRTAETEAGGAAGAASAAARKPEWQAVLDLIRETDGALYQRIMRRLMNYLIRLGVPGVHSLITECDPASHADRERDSRGQNQPLPKRNLFSMDLTFAEVRQVAAIALEDADIAVLLKQWIRQDKLGFLTHALERHNISFLGISEIVQRFCRETREGDPALSPSDDRKVRVALARRFLSDSLSYIRIAKDHMRIHDFGRLLSRVVGPAQGRGRLGGKATGLILASHILRSRAQAGSLIEKVRIPHTWYVTTDALFEFIHYNALDDLQSLKFASIDEVQHGFPYLEQVFKRSFFPQELVQQMRVALEDLGEGPLIVRSSSLLEDSEGTAFSGKYRSLFLANMGTREQRLAALLDAIEEVYASVFGPDPIQYRAERGLLDFQEEMGIIIQQVVGRRVGKYFFPAFAGVAFSNNEFRWSPTIRREDGVLRLVLGLGTRAVDRIGDDFPTLVSPGRPELRVNVTPEQIMYYSQRKIDVLNLETGRFESPAIDRVFKEAGDAFPMLEKLVSIRDGGSLRKPLKTMLDPRTDDLVVTCAGLLESTDFVKQMREILKVLQESLGMPVDVEFAHDGKDLYILQCRSQSRFGDEERVSIPHYIPDGRKLFSANRFVTNGRVSGIRYVVYVDPDEYAGLGSRDEMVAVADAVSRLNALLPRRSFILMGPGRWGSRGDISLGVGVTYAGICNTLMLIEIARKKGGYVPDLSFGTHFFQDLVEAKIRYLALYPDTPGVLFEERFFRESPSVMSTLLPDHQRLDRVIRVIDVPAVTGGCELIILMDGEKEHALAFFSEPGRSA